MNDTERDLRELFESKAREAGTPPVTRKLLRRGRRRQLGTVAIAGATTVVVLAGAVVGLRAMRVTDERVPGGGTGNPPFTSTIANVTIDVPEGWTLIDQWPIGVNMPTQTTVSNCSGPAVEAGSAVGTGASEEQECKQTSTPADVDPRGLPILTLSNQDPGLVAPVCEPDGTVPATSATLFVAINAAVMQLPDWESQYAVDRGPLVNVLPDDGLPDHEMPCGGGGYDWFQAGGLPYIAWSGLGEDVSEADRQALFDAYEAMVVADERPAPPSVAEPGYVLTGGEVDGVPWNLEVSPSEEYYRMVVNGPADVIATGSVAPHEIARQSDPGTAEVNGTRILWGAVDPSTTGVVYRPDDGSDDVAGSIVRFPDALGIPFEAFVVLVDASSHGQLVFDMPQSETDMPLPSEKTPTVEDRRVHSALRNAYVAAKTFFTDRDSFWGFAIGEASAIEPTLVYNIDPVATIGEVSIRDVGRDHLVLASVSGSGTVFCIAEQPGGRTTYGAVDAQTAAECVGGEAAWGISAPPPFPPPSLAFEGIAAGQSAGTAWNVVVDGDRLALWDGSGTELASATVAPAGAMSAGTFVFEGDGRSERVVFGVIKTPVTEVSPLLDEPRYDTTLVPSFRGLPEETIAYVTTFRGGFFDGIIFGFSGPCEAVTAFRLHGNEAISVTPPIFNCDRGGAN
jgi:hypothetical protein